MSATARILAVVATIVVLVVAFLVLSPGDDEHTATTPTSSQTTQTTTTAAPPAAAPRPSFETIRVRGGKPVGGIHKIRLKQGDRARIEVSSPDTSDEIHVHGYDLMKDLKAGGRVRFSFEAGAEGIFEIELEGAGVQVAELVVEPG